MTTPLCPRCGARGRSVADLTVEALVREAERGRLTPKAAMYCSTSSCEVVYFDAAGTIVDQAGVRVPVFDKHTSPERLVCYCFGHSVAEVLAAQQADGSNAVVEAITQECRRGLGHCERSNPRGRCCLGTLRSLVKDEAPSKACCCERPD